MLLTGVTIVVAVYAAQFTYFGAELLLSWHERSSVAGDAALVKLSGQLFSGLFEVETRTSHLR